MEIINRYVYAVTQKLPPSQREDIGNELRSLIEDMLEERCGDKHVNEEDVEAVLLELGNPRTLASKYRGTKKYLIGPELYDSFILVLKIVLIVISSIIGISFIIQSIITPFSILDHFIDMIISFVTALPTAFGWTTLSFAIGEHFCGIKQKDLLNEEWSPSTLPPIPNERRKIKRAEPIAGIIFYLIVITFLAFSSEYFGIWIFKDDFTGVVPFLNEQKYGTYLLFIIFIFGFGIIKECLKLIFGEWTYKLAVYTLVTNTISMIAIFFIIIQPDFWNPHFVEQLVEAGFLSMDSKAFHTVSEIWEKITFWILVLTAFGLVWDAIDGFWRARKK